MLNFIQKSTAAAHKWLTDPYFESMAVVGDFDFGYVLGENADVTHVVIVARSA